MQNKLVNLNNILFEQLERLNDFEVDSVDSEILDNEIKRAKAIADVSSKILECGQLALSSYKVVKDYDPDEKLLEILGTQEA